MKNNRLLPIGFETLYLVEALRSDAAAFISYQISRPTNNRNTEVAPNHMLFPCLVARRWFDFRPKYLENEVFISRLSSLL
jgi:hypothetical protein